MLRRANPLNRRGELRRIRCQEVLKSISGASDTLPSSIDAFYLPKAKQPFFLFQMFGLGTSFSGIVADLIEISLQTITCIRHGRKAGFS